MQAEDLYFSPEDLYRLGNASDPKLTQVRSRDVDTTQLNGIVIVIANGKGVSLSTRMRLEKSPMTGWVWKIAKGTPLPTGLKLIKDSPDHYCAAPATNMPLDEYKGLLAKLALRCQKLFLKQAAR